jgi:hypothetical protein
VTACCNPTTGSCTITGTDPCPSGTIGNAGLTCAPNPCPQPPPPANDDCGASATLAVGSTLSGQTINNATQTTTASCTGTDIDVWYAVTSASDQLVTITAVPASATDSGISLSVFSACGSGQITTTGACVAQPADGTTTTITFAATTGSTYHVRAAAFQGDTGSFSISAAGAAAGACCNNTSGACTTTTAAGCTSGAYQGDNTSCNPSPCAQGACCNATTGSCSTTSPTGCSTVFQGVGTVCTPNPCGQGACCNAASGACTLSTQAGCASPSTFQGAGTACSPNPCAVPPAPANDECSGAFPVTVGANPGNNYGATTGAPVTSAAQCGTTLTGASGGNDVFYRFTPSASGDYTIDTCSGVSYDTVLSIHSACPSDTSVTLACNDDADTACPSSTVQSRIPSVTLTAGQTYYIRVARYGTTPSPTDTSTFTLNINPLFTTSGVCCRGSTCSTDTSNCTVTPGSQAGAVVSTSGFACNAQGNNTGPCCKADYNKQNNVDLLDIFAFLNDWFAARPYADFDGQNGVDLLDIFAFLNAWFAGLCA